MSLTHLCQTAEISVLFKLLLGCSREIELLSSTHLMLDIHYRPHRNKQMLLKAQLFFQISAQFVF